MSREKIKDYSLLEIEPTCQLILGIGGTFFQKFTCAHCGSRQTMETANMLFVSGSCEECGESTDIIKSGCNVAAVFKSVFS